MNVRRNSTPQPAPVSEAIQRPSDDALQAFALYCRSAPINSVLDEFMLRRVFDAYRTAFTHPHAQFIRAQEPSDGDPQP